VTDDQRSGVTLDSFTVASHGLPNQ